jgi:hypothetical protein
MVIMKHFLWLLVGLAAWAVNPAAASLITVSGDVSGAWSADTVLVTSEVRVPLGQTLTIQPGVNVLFGGYYKFIVDQFATLTAAGTASDSIRFDVFTVGTHWHGLRFLPASDASRLEYCILKNGLASGSGEDAKGGAISCAYSSPTISHSTVQSNSADTFGGGIYCFNASPAISANTITGNSSQFGGGIFCFTSNSVITGNTISYNSNGLGGTGGGIYCTDSNPAINSNVIRHNTSGTGGGVYLQSPPAFFQFNEISENTATGFGGGLYIDRITFALNKNTIVGNTAFEGGGMFLNSSHLNVNNSILWNNTPQQIYPTGGSTLVITYSDIQGAWTGNGNINSDPLFVNAPGSDYHLQAGSPCINTGDPNSLYNDPDGSRADIGCYYFQQGSSLQITLTPINPPILVPSSGGSFNFTAAVVRAIGPQAPFTVWARIKNPNGTYTAPTLGPVTINTPVGVTITRTRNQTVPGAWPLGLYTYLGYANTNFSYPAIDSSSFQFTKSAVMGNGPEVTEAFCSGELFPGEQSMTAFLPSGLQLESSPNPFNPVTTIRFSLPEAAHVTLNVYDVTGRQVAQLVNGLTAAGTHLVTFDGSTLASGVYLYRLTVGMNSATGKMVLMK